MVQNKGRYSSIGPRQTGLLIVNILLVNLFGEARFSPKTLADHAYGIDESAYPTDGTFDFFCSLIPSVGRGKALYLGNSTLAICISLHNLLRTLILSNNKCYMQYYSFSSFE